MGKGLPRSMSRGNPLKQEVMRQVFTAEDLAITVDGATGVGWGTAVLGDLPAGNILLLGAVSYLTFTTASALVQAAFDGDYAIGTAPTADASLSGSEVDIIPSTALGAATAKVSPRARGVSTTSLNGAILDNTDGSLELNLNLLIDDANISADDVAFTADGELILLYAVLGDD